MKHTLFAKQYAVKPALCFLLFLLNWQNISFSQNQPNTQKAIQMFPTWEGGAFFGISLIYGDLVNDVAIISSANQPAYGLFAIRNFSPNWSARLNILHTRLKANDLDSELEGHRARGFSHETPLTEISLLGQWDWRGKRRYQRIGFFKKTVSPYFFAGLAGGIGQSDTFYDDREESPAIVADKKNTTAFRLAFPLGGGLKIDLSQRSFVNFEFGVRPTFDDLLDGVSESGNPDKNDWYAFGGMCIGYRFASDDADGDGVVDAKDKCPGVAGERQFRGCPDTDGDGVQDKNDECPLIAGAKTMNGCPDSDLDGVADTEDECPDVKGLQRLQGCPDADWDNVIDKNDACPNTPGLPEFRGCPDTDLDGIMDLEDNCPEIAGLPQLGGCPEGHENAKIQEIPEEIVDTTITVVVNVPTATPEAVLPDLSEAETPVIEENTNPSDSEQETDSPDLTEPADILSDTPVANPASPKPSNDSPDKTVLPAFEMIRFATASNELLPTEKRQLDKIAAILPDFPQYNLLIFGYTDNVGNDVLNQQLSEKRAKACYDYLLDKGINPERMSFKGFGEMNPIATNETPQGRAKNRRVVLQLQPE